MLSRLSALILLFSLTSCSLFKSQSIQSKKTEDLISYLKGTGEGKGRLGIGEQKYLFSFDAILKENSDWILAANIPLHGEEVLKLQNLRLVNVEEGERDGLELRIEQGIRSYLKSQKRSPELAKKFLLELRNIMRLILHKKLDIETICSKSECRIGETIYQVEATSKQLSLKKSLSEDYEIELTSMNLTESIFQRSSVFLRSKNKSSSSPTLLSLELFWN